MRILIIGAGVAGCIVARQLARLDGIEVTCIERVSADDHAEAGTGLNIGPNAVRSLQALDPALANAITATSYPWEDWTVSTTAGTPLLKLSVPDLGGVAGWRIRWSELYRVLREAAGDRIEYGCTVTEMAKSPTTSGKLEVQWTRAGETTCLHDIDLIIAADGRYSNVRRKFSGEPAIRQVGVAISRVLVPDIGASSIDDYEQWFCGSNRLLAFRVPPGHIYIACAVPIDSNEVLPEHVKSPEFLRAAFTPTSGELAPKALWLVDTVCDHAAQTHWARMQEHDVLYADKLAPVMYLGDAAHGMVPTLGQGATQAIEDAAIAAETISRMWLDGDKSTRQWLTTVDERRRDRIDFVMRFSLEATDTMLAGSDPVSGTLRKAEPAFIEKLKRLYCDVPALLDTNRTAKAPASAGTMS